MKIQMLEYFVTLASYLHYSQAAKQLYISQPALSKHINALEKELGVKLFKRNKHTVTLTPEGEVCLAKANNVIFAHRDMIEWADSVKAAKMPSLKIGYYGMFLQDVVFLLLQNLWKINPKAEVSLRWQGINSLLPSLRNNWLDIVIINEYYFENLKGLDFEKVCSLDYKLALPSHHPLTQRKRVRLDELQNEKFIFYSQKEYVQSYNSTLTLCQKYGLSPNIAIECVDSVTFALMIQSGKYIAICPARYNSLYAYDIKLVDLDCDPQDIQCDIVAVWNTDNKNPLIPLFRESIKMTCRSLQDGMPNSIFPDKQ